MSEPQSTIINEKHITTALESTSKSDSVQIREILSKSTGLGGLNLNEVAALCTIKDADLTSELFEAARTVKEHIYGRRLVLFAPLYISNLCGNECLYCAFRAGNTGLQRKALTQEEIAQETTILINQGHKRILLVAGESYPAEGFDYVLKSIDTVYAVKSGPGEIRRVNVNVAPLSVDQFKLLKTRNIGTYQIFQETYHRDTYSKMHLAGRKKDYDWRVEAPSRAMEAGINDVGIGVLFGLYDWRFELLALMQHVQHLDSRFDVGPHTISVPRLEPAAGSAVATTPPYSVSDTAFRKIVAILRLAVPYTGIIMSTRETAQTRRDGFALGVSQISAGSRTNPGGYAADNFAEDSSQFSLGDHRPLDEVIADIAKLGYVPSFCTGCYRLGRTGKDFMDLARPGDIRTHCDPNAATTFMEYLNDYASPQTRQAGETALERFVADMAPATRDMTKKMIAKVRDGEHDVYC